MIQSQHCFFLYPRSARRDEIQLSWMMTYIFPCDRIILNVAANRDQLNVRHFKNRLMSIKNY